MGKNPMTPQKKASTPSVHPSVSEIQAAGEGADDRPTPEQAALEAEVEKQRILNEKSQIGSEYERHQRQLLEEAEAKTAAAELALGEARIARERVERAKDQERAREAKKEAAQTYVFYAKYDKTIGLKLDASLKRVPLTFVHRAISVNPSLVETIKRMYGIEITPEELVAALKRLPDYGIDFLLVAGPGVELSDEQEDFRLATLQAIGRTQSRVIQGLRSSRSGA